VLAALCACSPQSKVPPLDAGAVDQEARLQHEMAVRDAAGHLEQLYRVAWNIRAMNVDLCGDHVAASFGFTLVSLKSYKNAMQRAAVKNVIHAHDAPTVFLIGPGGPADVAGLARGDVVVSIDGQPAETRKHARQLLSEALKVGRPVVLETRRDGAIISRTLKPFKICGYPVLMDPSAEINAHASGDAIYINKGIIKFIKNDDELAAIVGHEMGHNVRQHLRDQDFNSAVGHLLVDLPIRLLLGVNTYAGAQVGAQMFSPEYEAEADYVGLYYAARAGYDIHNVADVWRRMSVEYPQIITLVTTHPSNSQRFVGLAADAAEIDRKRAEGLPLVPELKGSSAKKPATTDAAKTPPAPKPDAAKAPAAKAPEVTVDSEADQQPEADL